MTTVTEYCCNRGQAPRLDDHVQPDPVHSVKPTRNTAALVLETQR